MADFARAVELSHNRILWAERRAWFAMLGCLLCAFIALGLAGYAVQQAGKTPATVPVYVELAQDGRLLQATALGPDYTLVPKTAIQARLVEWITRLRRRPADPVLATRDIEWALQLADEPTLAALSARLIQTRPIDDIHAGLTIDIEPLSAIERQEGHWELMWRETQRGRGKPPSSLTYRGLISIELQAVPVSVERPFGELITYVDYAPMNLGQPAVRAQAQPM